MSEKPEYQIEDHEKRFLFTVCMIGQGTSEEEAYNNALESFVVDPGDYGEVR